MNNSKRYMNKLSFVHIPKTAGLSLHDELEKHYGKACSLRVGSREDRCFFLSMSTEQLYKYNYIGGHVSVEELSKKEINYPIISVVREPVKRLISLQNYLTNSNRNEHQGINYESIEQLLKNMLHEGQINMQCWHLSGKHSYDCAIESIKNNKIFVVPLEHYQDLIDTLSNLLGTPLSNRRSNVTQYKTSINSDNLNNEILDHIIGDDNKLFSYVKQNYENLKKEFIQSLTR